MTAFVKRNSALTVKKLRSIDSALQVAPERLQKAVFFSFLA